MHAQQVASSFSRWGPGLVGITACTKGGVVGLRQIQVSWEKEIYFKNINRDVCEYLSPRLIFTGI